jgi:hypothetical protein
MNSIFSGGKISEGRMDQGGFKIAGNWRMIFLIDKGLSIRTTTKGNK